MLKRKGSTETRKRSAMFRRIALCDSRRRTDIIRVYRSQITIRMRKLKPKVASALVDPGYVGRRAAHERDCADRQGEPEDHV